MIRSFGMLDGAEALIATAFGLGVAIQRHEVFGTDATPLTDYFHVSEYLAAAAPEPWRRTQQKRLKRGASAQVVAELGAHRYFANRPDTLDYAAAIAAGLPSAAASSSRDTSTCSKRGSNFPATPGYPPTPNSSPSFASSVQTIAGKTSGPSPLEFRGLGFNHARLSAPHLRSIDPRTGIRFPPRAT